LLRELEEAEGIGLVLVVATIAHKLSGGNHLILLCVTLAGGPLLDLAWGVIQGRNSAQGSRRLDHAGDTPKHPRRPLAPSERPLEHHHVEGSEPLLVEHLGQGGQLLGAGFAVQHLVSGDTGAGPRHVRAQVERQDA